MSVQVIFHRLAAREARLAEAWYADRSAETAARFRTAVRAATGRIITSQATHCIGRSRFKYVNVPRFPYRLIYFFSDATTARVVAVAHARRSPDYWRRRR